MLKAAKRSDRLSRFIKRFIYSQLTVGDAFMIMIGRQQPRISFRVLDDPCSIYINFEVKKELAGEFADYINAAEGLTLTPVSCLDNEEPRLLVTLNIYEVSGLVSGARAEWSTYVTDSTGHPRYMVLEAQAARGSMDPVNLVTRAGRVKHTRSGSYLESEVYAQDANVFRSRLRFDDAHPLVRLAPQWIAANDYIYWRNGVCDRALYDGQFFNASVRSIPAADFTIDDETHWARFLEPTPRHVLQYEGGFDLMVSPWYNI